MAGMVVTLQIVAFLRSAMTYSSVQNAPGAYTIDIV